MVNWTGLGIFAIIFLAILAIVSNTSATSIANIQTQFNRITCPLPAGSGLWNSSGTIMYSGATYNYPSVSNMTLTLTCTPVHTLDSVDYCLGCPTVAIGVFFFAVDYISELIVNKVGAFLTIAFFIITPANFNILGFTIDDLTGIPLMFLIAIYAICYVAIGAMLYKTILPTTGE